MPPFILDAAQAALVAKGTKTIHRRLAIPGADCPYQEGAIVPVLAVAERETRWKGLIVRRRRAGGAVCHIRIEHATRHPLEDITEAEARAEGYPTLGVFLDAWQTRYGPPQGDHTEECWRIEFRVATRLEPVRYLAPKSGYTHDPRRALTDPPPTLDETTVTARQIHPRPEPIVAVDAATLERYSDDARRRWQAERDNRRARERALRELLTLEQRLAAIQARAKTRRVTASREIYVLRRLLDAGRDTAAHARLERLERRIDNAA